MGSRASPPQLPEWCPPSRASIHRSIGISATRAERDGRPVGGEPRPVRADQHIGGEQIAMLGAEFAQARRAGFFAHLDQPFGVEAELAALGEYGRLRGDIDRVLALVVDHAASVVAAVLLGHGPGRKARAPAGIEPADDVAMAVAEHGRQRRVFDPLGEQERTFRALLRQRAALETELFQRRCDFT